MLNFVSWARIQLHTRKQFTGDFFPLFNHLSTYPGHISPFLVKTCRIYTHIFRARVNKNIVWKTFPLYTGSQLLSNCTQLHFHQAAFSIFVKFLQTYRQEWCRSTRTLSLQSSLDQDSVSWTSNMAYNSLNLKQTGLLCSTMNKVPHRVRFFSTWHRAIFWIWIQILSSLNWKLESVSTSRIGFDAVPTLSWILFSGWFYHAPAKRKNADAVGYPPPSQIPGLNGMREEPPEENQRCHKHMHPHRSKTPLRTHCISLRNKMITGLFNFQMRFGCLSNRLGILVQPCFVISELKDTCQQLLNYFISFRSHWIKDTDSDYVVLAKQGGRPDLLRWSTNTL